MDALLNVRREILHEVGRGGLEFCDVIWFYVEKTLQIPIKRLLLKIIRLQATKNEIKNLTVIILVSS